MRLRRYIGLGVAVAFAVAFGLTVYFTTRTSHVERGALTTSELRWAHAYGVWNARMRGKLTTAYLASRGATDVRQVHGPLGQVSDCRSTFDADVGAAPERLRPVATSALVACREASIALTEFRRQHVAGDPQRSAHVLYGIRALDDANDELEQRLLVSKPLPRRGGETGASRIEPRLTAAAGSVTEYDADVKCWSRSDWPHVHSELVAVAPALYSYFIGAAQSYGVKDIGGHRRSALAVAVQLSPQTCERLDGLAYGHDVPTAGADGAALVRALVELGAGAEQAAGADRVAASCYGLQDVRPLAAHLGATRAQAAQLASVAAALYAKGELGPRSSRCRDGGELDKSGSSIWP